MTAKIQKLRQYFAAVFESEREIFVEKGLVHIYFGYGKGKTTAAIGLAHRCAAWGYKVLYTAFLKKSDSGEFLGKEIYETVLPKVKEGFFWTLSDEKKKAVQKEAKERLLCVFKTANDEKKDMLVLDEALDAIEVGAFSEDELCDLICMRHTGLEVVITGHKVSEKLLDIADYVTEMREIKHPYKKGIAARKGIEK